MRQLDVGHLKLGTLSTQNGEVVAPVELEGIARTEEQGHKGPPSCRLLLMLMVCAPVPRKGGHAAAETCEAELDQIGVHPWHFATTMKIGRKLREPAFKNLARTDGLPPADLRRIAFEAQTFSEKIFLRYIIKIIAATFTSG